MKPRILKINNVRSYSEAIINYGDAKLIYYYGLNGSGKTTIARALLFLTGMEPEDGDIKIGEESLSVEGHFDVSDITSSLVPRGDILIVQVQKQMGHKAKYKLGEEGKRISHARISEFFSSVGASPSQVFIQMGSIPLPFRSAVEEHIKKRGLMEHRRRRFTALMDLMGIRDFIGILEEKKLDYDRVMEIYKEAKLDLIDVTRNFELIKTQYERYLEYKATKQEIENLKKLKKVVSAATSLRKLKEIASSYGDICRKRKQMVKELEEKEETLKELIKVEKELDKEYKRLSEMAQSYEIKKNRILADIGKIEGQLKSLGEVAKPVDEKYMAYTIPQIESELQKLQKQIKSLTNKKNALASKKETIKGQRESIKQLLEDRKKELENLLTSAPEPVDYEKLQEMSVQIGEIKRRIKEIREKKRKWQEKLKKSPVIVKDERYASLVGKVLSLFLDKDIVPLEKEIAFPYLSLGDYVDTKDDAIAKLLRRVFVVPDKEAADIVRASGAIAIVHDEMWDWWGIWEDSGIVVTLALSTEQVDEEDTTELEEKLSDLEREYRRLESQYKAYQRYQDKVKFVQTDIESLSKKLDTMPDINTIVEELRTLDRQIETLRIDEEIAKSTLQYLRYISLSKRRERLYKQLEDVQKDAPDKKKIEEIVARLSSISTDKSYLEKDISRLKSITSRMRREMLELKDNMLKVSAVLSGYSKELLAEAVSYEGDLSEVAIDRQIALLEAKLQGMGEVEDVSARYREMEETLANMKKRFEEVDKWRQEALEDLLEMKKNLIGSIKHIQDKITEIFSDFLSTFGFDGKIEIHVDTDAPKTIGDVVVSIRSRDGVWNDYDVMRLSGGEGILVAFSLYLAAWMVKTGNVHFLMIDEAQTNLDKVNFEKLLKLLLDKVPGQIHVFTMVEPPKMVAERNDTKIFHIARNVFDMASEVMEVG